MYCTWFATVQIFAQQTATISGAVLDKQTNEVLSYAQVVLVGTTMGATTDENGQFHIVVLKSGIYEIKTTMMGFSPQSIKAKVENGSEVVVTFKLQPTVLDADEIFVTATKMDKAVKNIGGAVYMIQESELRQSDSRNIQDVLTRVPGVFTQDKFHNEHNVVTFRGVGLHTYVTRGILVLVDGISVNEAMGRSVFEGINLENAERVEILKGPVSALYGPNGITGVINIITKKAPEKLDGSLSYTNGAYNSKRFSGQLGTTFGKTGVYANALVYSSDGYMDRNAYDTKKINTRLSSEFDMLGSLDLTFDYTESTIDYAGSLTREQYENDETAGTSKYTGSEKQLMRLGLRSVKDLNKKSHIASNIYYRSRFDQGHYMDIRYGESDLNLLGGEIQLQSKIMKDKIRYVVGASHDRETGDSQTYNRDEDGIVQDLIGDGTSNYNISGAYTQADVSILTNLTAILGIRYDNVAYDWQDNFLPDSSNTSASTTIGAVSPKFGIAYNPFELMTIFGNWGRGFNPPEMDQLFSSDSESNPDLKPEYLTNYEIGIRGRLGPRVNYQISAFKMDFVDQVVKDEETDYYENIGNTEHKGLETSINAMIMQNMMIYLNYSYLKASFVDHPLYEGNALVKIPENQIGAGVRMTLLNDLTVSLDYKWMDKFFMDNEETNIYDGHSVVNAKMRYNYKRYHVALSVDNLLDTHYASSAAARYAIINYRTREYGWIESFYPGWPRNFNLTIGIDF